jgi:hypothetical protein
MLRGGALASGARCVLPTRSGDRHAPAHGSLRNPFARLSRIEVLVIDDWAMAPRSEAV